MRTVLFLLISWLALVSLLAADEGAPSSYESDPFFRAQILPIFERRCFQPGLCNGVSEWRWSCLDLA
ncbi:MAG: hypothetical protein ACOYOF_15630, partial [Verrucomicrobiaceae bacterium]